MTVWGSSDQRNTTSCSSGVPCIGRLRVINDHSRVAVPTHVAIHHHCIASFHQLCLDQRYVWWLGKKKPRPESSPSVVWKVLNWHPC